MDNPFIKKLQAYGGLSPTEVQALVEATGAPQRLPAKRDLIREGDRPGPVFVVLEGWAVRYKVLPNGARQVLAYLMPGDSCDLHVSLLAEMDHSIQTITPALVATISRADMDAIMDRHRGVARAMYLAQLVDEGTLRAWITSMGRRTSIERVAHLMCELYVRARTIGLTATPRLELPVSQLLLADSLGMTPVHLNRVLRELRTHGAVTLQRGSLTISNPNKLVEIAGFNDNYLHQRLRTAG
jgi:CRP-like cAMP-binding protein